MYTQESKSLIKCENCDSSFGTFNELKRHRILFHSHHKTSQCGTDDHFEQYNCFYCEMIIDSAKGLENQFVKCQDKFDEYQEVDLFLFDYCEANCVNMDDSERHVEAYHRMGTVLEGFKNDVFQRNICPLVCQLKGPQGNNNYGCIR